MRKLLFVYNPHSGTGKIRLAISDVVDIFAKANFEVTIYPTQTPGDGGRKVQEAGAQYDRIVVAGGDGMFHEVVDAILRLPSPVPVGYLPTGTVNDFAATHRLPKELTKAADIAASDHIVTLDAGKFNNTYFTYVAAFGLATQAAYETDQSMKNKLGSLAYLLEVIKSFDLKHFEAACRRVSITTSCAELNGDFIFGCVTNSTSVAGMKNFVHSDVQFDDGLLEGLFIRRPSNLLELEQMKLGLASRDLTAPCLLQMQAPEFQITSEPMAWTLDGENGGEQTSVQITAAVRALHIALPELPVDPSTDCDK